ncbi:hypothetical protein [Calidifontibacillus oryziterrae]|uniref:hypothetical protein n=1 Tax=Calidifontibacillus oryziterrae TaxID=1191699 RepID=UPI00031DE309|nr:hypothetical protein [Calidifontibacillus oryziterrae]
MNRSLNDETSKERRIRLALLGIVIVIVMISFYFQSQKFEQINTTNELENDFKPLVSVIKQTSGEENPIVVVVKKHEGKPVLILYEIHITDRYRFETIGSHELMNYPEKIFAVDNSGFWMNSNKEWRFFDLTLNSRPQNAEEVIVSHENLIKYESSKSENKVLVTVYLKGEKMWTEGFSDEPASIHPLSYSNDIWLVVFQNDFVIYESN